MNRKLLLGAVAALVGATLAGGAGVANAVVTQKTGAQAGAWTAPGEVLVRFKAGASSADIAAAHDALGAQVVKTFRIVPNLQHVRLTGAATVNGAIAAYEARADVLYAQPNFLYRLDRTPNDPMYGQLWAMNNTGQTGGTPDADIDAPEAWNRGVGNRRKVAVGVVDSGVDYNHPDLAANTKPNPLECNGTAGVDDDTNGYVDDCHGIDTFNLDSDPMDDFTPGGHGTHVSGTIGAVGNNSEGVVGVNWRVTIVACKSHSAAGVGTAASIIECFQYMEIEKEKGVNVVATNNSYGGCTEACGYDQATEDAIRSNMESGIIFVASAGNDSVDNDDVPKYPVGYFLPNVIGAAATTHTDALASFSNYGKRTVHVGAPGEGILSTWRVSQGSYGVFDGTSMASPHIVGTIALLKSQKPTLHWKRIRNLIWAGGDPAPGLSATTVTGRRINANGVGTCSGNHVEGVLRPADTEENFPVPVAYLNITCAKKAGANLTVTITPGGETISLNDDGIGPDSVINDGMYMGRWNPNPCVPGSYTFTFSNGAVATSNVTC